jgi:integrase
MTDRVKLHGLRGPTDHQVPGRDHRPLPEQAGQVGDFGGYSLRRGFATPALAGGATERAVQRHGRWRSPAFMNPYVDEAERFDDTNPTRFLGL